MAVGAGAARRGEDDAEDAPTVRPYAVTGGRTVSPADLPMEALVEGLARPDVRLSAERRRILELTAEQYQSVAELSARVRLPIGVVRVLVSELSEAKKVRVHGVGASGPAGASPQSTTDRLSVLERVLDGISAL